MKRLAKITLRHHSNGATRPPFYLAISTQRGTVVRKMALQASDSRDAPRITVGDVAALADAADLSLPLNIDVYAVPYPMPTPAGLPSTVQADGCSRILIH